jgi:hypothetical protein
VEPTAKSTIMSFLLHRNLAGGLRAVRAVRTARGPNPLITKEHERKHTSKCGRCGQFAQTPDFAGAGGARAVRGRTPHTPRRKSAPSRGAPRHPSEKFSSAAPRPRRAQKFG